MHVAGMDCADEAALIRRALNRPGITALNFDLVGRRVDVTYDPSIVPASAILAAVADTGLVAHTHDAGDVVGDDHHHHHHHHDTAKWWAAASLACFAAGWIIDGAAAETWSVRSSVTVRNPATRTRGRRWSRTPCRPSPGWRP